MPSLRQVLPAGCCPEGQLEDLLDVAVTAIKLNIGSPCGSNGDLFAAWPGPHAHVRQWFCLANGEAVAINEDPDTGLTCPVVRLVR
jgi:hypothetical protein